MGSATGSQGYIATPTADTVTTGLVTSGQQSFGGLKKFEGGLASVGINVATDADAPLDNTSSRHITFTGFTTTRNVTLPTTGIVAGEIFTLINTAAFDMVVKSSNGSALTLANSANLDATVRSGYVVLKALQAAPTTPAHWLVVEVQEVYSYATTFAFNLGGTTNSATVVLRRFNKFVTGYCLTATATSYTNNSSILTANTAAPTRFFGNSDGANTYVGIAKATGVSQMGTINMSTSGFLTVQCKISGQTGVDWVNNGQTAGLAATSQLQFFTP